MLTRSHPEIAKEWHPTKNLPLHPYNFSYGSKQSVWWLGSCGHEWQMRVQSRTGQGCGCPVCKCNRKLKPLSATHPKLTEEWHKRNEISPDTVTAGMHINVWWQGSCGHEWQATIVNRSKPNKPSGCPFCANRSVDKTNSLASKHPELAAQWHPILNGELRPEQVNYRTYKAVWWLGHCGHSWKTLVRIRTRKTRPAGCPLCKDSAGESKIRAFLELNKIEYKQQFRFEDCRDKKPLPFDFKVGNILIEFQGIQHYEPVDFGGDYLSTFETVKKHDVIKKQWCKDNGYKLLEISYKQFEEIEEILKKEVIYS